MNKLIYILLSLIILSGVASATISGNIYVEATKAINGSQIFGLPVVEINIAKTPLLIDLEFRNNFTSPRGSLMQIPNHLSSEMNLHFGYISPNNTWVTYSLNGTYNYAGNDFGIPEGFMFGNSFRFGYGFIY